MLLFATLIKCTPHAPKDQSVPADRNTHAPVEQAPRPCNPDNLRKYLPKAVNSTSSCLQPGSLLYLQATYDNGKPTAVVFSTDEPDPGVQECLSERVEYGLPRGSEQCGRYTVVVRKDGQSHDERTVLSSTLEPVPDTQGIRPPTTP